MALDSRAARNSLAYDISKVHIALANARDERIGRRTPRHMGELIEKCNEVIREGAASADVYEAVFNTIVGQKEYEVRMQEYKDAAEALLQRLLQDKIAQQESDGRVVWPQCKQNKADLAELYVEAVSVKRECTERHERPAHRLRPLAAGDGATQEDEVCAASLRASSPPLSSLSPVCVAAVAHVRRLSCSPRPR